MASRKFDVNQRDYVAGGSYTYSASPSLKHMGSRKFDTNEKVSISGSSYTHSASPSLKTQASQKFGTKDIASVTGGSHTNFATPPLQGRRSQQLRMNPSTHTAGSGPPTSTVNSPLKAQKSQNLHLETLPSSVYSPPTQTVAKAPSKASRSHIMRMDNYPSSVPRSPAAAPPFGFTQPQNLVTKKSTPSFDSRTPGSSPEPTESVMPSRSTAPSPQPYYTESTPQIVPHAQFPSKVSPSDAKVTDGIKLLDGHAAAMQICKNLASRGDWDIVFVVQVHPKDPDSTDQALIAGDLLCKYLVIYAKDNMTNFPPLKYHLEGLRAPHHFLWPIPKDGRFEYCCGRSIVLYNEPGLATKRKRGILLTTLRRKEGRGVAQNPRSRAGELGDTVSMGQEIKKLFYPDPRTGDIVFLTRPSLWLSGTLKSKESDKKTDPEDHRGRPS